MSNTVKELVKKSEEAHASSDALRFSQAALNAANALARLYETERAKADDKPSA